MNTDKNHLALFHSLLWITAGYFFGELWGISFFEIYFDKYSLRMKTGAFSLAFLGMIAYTLILTGVLWVLRSFKEEEYPLCPHPLLRPFAYCALSSSLTHYCLLIVVN